MVVTYFICSKYISADSLNAGYPAVSWVKKQTVTTVHTDIYRAGYSVVTNMGQYRVSEKDYTFFENFSLGP
jgi:hypothetical protein